MRATPIPGIMELIKESNPLPLVLPGVGGSSRVLGGLTIRNTVYGPGALPAGRTGEAHPGTGTPVSVCSQLPFT